VSLAQTQFALFRLFVGLFVVVFFGAVFQYYKWRGMDRLEPRPSILVWMTIVGVMCEIFSSSVFAWSFPAAYANMPCAIYLALLILVVPLLGTAIVTRLVLFLLETRYQDFVTSDSVGKQRESYIVTDDGPSKPSWIPRSGWCLSAACCVGDRAIRMRAIKFLIGPRGVFLLFALLMVPFLIIFIVLLATSPVYYEGCTGCFSHSSHDLDYAQIGIGLYIFVFGVFVGVTVRNRKDPFGILRECLISMAWGLLAVIGTILSLVVPLPASNVITFNFMIQASITMMVFTQTLMQVLRGAYEERVKRKQRSQRRTASTSQLLGKLRPSKHKRPVSGTKLLDTIMDNPELLELFEQHVAAEFGMESVLFLKDSAQWIRTYYDVAPAARLARARKLYNMYIDVSGVFSVNIPSTCSSALNRALQGSRVEQTVFDEARLEVASLLERGAVARFMNSKAYKEFKESRRNSRDNMTPRGSRLSTALGGGGGMRPVSKDKPTPENTPSFKAVGVQRSMPLLALDPDERVQPRERRAASADEEKSSRMDELGLT